MADDTVERRRGKKVWGLSIHRDPLASSRKTPRFTPGHKWLTLCALVPIPFTGRYWALPLLAILLRTPKVDAALDLAHHTTRQRVRQGLLRLHRWFPQRRFCMLGDWGVASHELAWRVARTRGKLEIIARMRADTVLHQRPSRKGARKGKRLPTPRDQVQQHAQEIGTLSLPWYGSGQHQDAALLQRHGAVVQPPLGQGGADPLGLDEQSPDRQRGLLLLDRSLALGRGDHPPVHAALAGGDDVPGGPRAPGGADAPGTGARTASSG